MNLLLIVRAEVVCLVILLYLVLYSWRFIRENDFFRRLNLFGLSHVVFDIITIHTVNNLSAVPPWLNWLCHVLFYIFAILFCCELLRYVLDVVSGGKYRIQRLVYLLPLAYLAATPFLRIDYLQGRGSNYSYGPCVFAGYGLAMLLFFASEALLLCNFRKLEANVKKTLVPGFALMTVAVIVQAFVPELLFTGAGVTLVSVGVFLSIANPMEKYRERAYYDTCLKIKNRNAYTDEMQKFVAMPAGELLARRFTLAVFDLNSLKRINDQYGHPVGDAYLQAASEILQAELRSARNVFRTGGDEFVAVYLDTEADVVGTEVANVAKTCAQREMNYALPLSISSGYAVMEQAETVYSVERRADEEMFIQKRKHYQLKEFDRRRR